MKYSVAAITAILAHASAHGVISQVQGANGVNMPGLSGEHPSFSSLYTA